MTTMTIDTKISERVNVVRLPVEGTWRTKFAVTLDGVVVLDTGSATRLDDLQAHSFASGLARGLSLAADAAL